MTRFFETLSKNKKSLDEEVYDIERLLKQKIDLEGYIRNVSIEEVLQYNFLSWSRRENHTRLLDMQIATGVAEIVGKVLTAVGYYKLDKKEVIQAIGKKAYKEIKKNGMPYISIDEYIVYAEYLLNILPLVWSRDEYTRNHISTHYETLLIDNDDYMPIIQHQVPDLIKSIALNIKNTISTLGHRIILSKDKYIIIPTDVMALDIVAKVANQPKLVDDIQLYNHHTLKGDLSGKAAILNRINMVFETKWEAVLKNRGNNNLVRDIGYIANKFGIRHGETDNESKIIEKFPKGKKEKWYDNLFALYLTAYRVSESAEVQSDLDKLKQEILAEMARKD